MKNHKLSGACVAIVAMIAMAVATPAQASTQSSSAPTAPMIVAPPSLDPLTSAAVAAVVRTGVPFPRAREAIEVQSAVEREDLIGELEAALGDGFGGVWYVPAAAQLHVGVTSQDAASIAEAVAVRAGLGLSVTEIPVRSSQAELFETQERLNRRLANLLTREEVETRVSVDDNSIDVELGSEVPADEQAALEGEASEAPVEIIVTRASRSKLGTVLQARCRKFEKNKAYCDPTIVAGTRLVSANVCTTGPAVLPPKGSTDTYVLTAGHCVGKVNESFSSFDKKKEEEKEVGKAVAFLNKKEKNKADIAAVRVEGNFWKEEGKEIPVVPAIVEWDKNKETDPFKVKGKVAPALEAVSCVSGQTSGSKCGTIVGTGVTQEGIEKLVEVEVEAVTEGGDSGSPWYSGVGEKLVQGVHRGLSEKSGLPLFQDLDFAFAQLKEVWKLELELLTEKNEKRM